MHGKPWCWVKSLGDIFFRILKLQPNRNWTKNYTQKNDLEDNRKSEHIRLALKWNNKSISTCYSFSSISNIVKKNPIITEMETCHSFMFPVLNNKIDCLFKLLFMTLISCLYFSLSPLQGVLPSWLQSGVHLPHFHPSHRLWQFQVSNHLWSIVDGDVQNTSG